MVHALNEMMSKGNLVRTALVARRLVEQYPDNERFLRESFKEISDSMLHENLLRLPNNPS